MKWQNALIIGASSGIGRALAYQLAAEGTSVGLIARRGDLLAQICSELNTKGSQRILPYQHDVRLVDEIPTLLRRITNDLGRLDLIIYAAGVLPPHTSSTVYQDQDAIAINLVGAIAWLREIVPIFSQAHKGTIIGISSLAGDRGRTVRATYSASKSGLNTYLESLHNILYPFGVKVITVKPGYVSTSLTAQEPRIKYAPLLSTEQTAKAILRAANRRCSIVYIPWYLGLIMFIVRFLPRKLFWRIEK